MSSSYVCFNLLPSPFRIQGKFDHQNSTHINVKKKIIKQSYSGTYLNLKLCQKK